MSATSASSPVLGPGARAPSWRRLIDGLVATARAWRALRRSRDELRRLSGHELHDIGLSRSDQLSELDRAGWWR